MGDGLEGDRLPTGQTLYLDCFSGVAGDMFIAALVDLGVPWEPLHRQLSRLELPLPFDVTLGSRRHHGIAGADLHVTIAGRATGYDEPASGGEGHEVAWLQERFRELDLAEGVKARAGAMLARLGEARAVLAGAPSSPPLAGSELVDTAVDLLGAALALEALGARQVLCSPLPLGHGRPHRRSGLPVPSPLALELLRGAPIRGGEAAGELCTPTGATIVACSVDSFEPLPEGRLVAVGYGAGDQSLPDRPNHLRALLLEAV